MLKKKDKWKVDIKVAVEAQRRKVGERRNPSKKLGRKQGKLIDTTRKSISTSEQNFSEKLRLILQWHR